MTRKERRQARRERQRHAAQRCALYGLTYSGRAYLAQANVYERSGWFVSAVSGAGGQGR